MMSLRLTRPLTPLLVRATTYPTVTTIPQSRSTGIRLPKYLKGKLFWKRHDRRGKKDPERVKKLHEKEELKIRTSQFHWIPETEIEKLYQKLIMEAYHTNKRHAVYDLYSMLDAVKQKEDLQFALRFFRIMSFRHLKFREDTMKRLCEVLFKYDEYAAVIELMKNRSVLRLPVDDSTAQFVLDKLFEKGEFNDQIVEIIGQLTKGKIKPLTSTSYDFIISKVDTSVLPRLYTDLHPQHVLHLQPESYEAILNASEGVEGFDKILKRIEADLSVVIGRSEKEEEILGNVLNKLAELSAGSKEVLQQQGEENA